MSILWWGYIHNNGSIQVKRYFDPTDINEARASPFVRGVTGPFYATGREDAAEKATAAFNLD